MRKASRGIGLVELAVGIVTAAVIALVSAKLFQLAVAAHTYTIRQGTVLSAANKAQDGQGSKDGMLKVVREGYQFEHLSTSSFTVLSSSPSVPIGFFLSGTALYKNDNGAVDVQSDKVDSLTLNYYSVTSSGTVFESTITANAYMVTTLYGVQGLTSKQKTYTFFSGARLRNK